MTAVVSYLAFEYLLMKAAHYSIEVNIETMDEEEMRDKAFFTIEQMGFEVGIRVMEKLAIFRSHLFIDTLDIFKFLCKDFWTLLFRKPIDNLKTNHKGTFVLLDNNFSWIERFTPESGWSEAGKMAILYVAFPCGCIRGALSVMGITANVMGEIVTFPQCAFQVRIDQK